MYNFYQSKIRRDIQKEVYKNPHFVMHLFGTEYFGVIKEKKLGPWKFRWHQILGVQLPTDQELVKKELEHAKKKLQTESGNVFLQLGIVNGIISFENATHTSEEFDHDMKEMRLHLQDFLCANHGFQTAFRENMPNSDIIVDVSKTDDQLMSEMNASARQRVRKAIKNKVEFGTATPDQYKLFYEKRLATSENKGFNIIPYDQFERLIKYIVQTGCGNIFITGMGQEIYSGNICLYDGQNIIYIYGFTDRDYGKLGSHHYLLYRMFSRARDNNFLYYDFMGGAPTGFPKHPLTSVSEFKESLGGEKIEYYGNYDVVINKFLYRVFKLWYKLRK